MQGGHRFREAEFHPPERALAGAKANTVGVQEISRLISRTRSFPGGSITTWAEIRGGRSSPEVTDARAFCGAWNNMNFCLWGRAVELLIDQVTMALTGQVKIYANLLCDVGVRYPGAFAVTAAVPGRKGK